MQDLCPHCSESTFTFQTTEAGKSTLLHESFRTPAGESRTALVGMAYLQLWEVR